MTSFNLDYSIDVDAENAVVYGKAFGVWGADTVVRFRKDFEAAVAPIVGKPWVYFADLSKLRAAHQDAVNVGAKFFEWSKRNNLVLSLYALNNPSIYRQLNEAIRKGGLADTSKTFRSLADAQKYLKEHWLEKTNPPAPSKQA